MDWRRSFVNTEESQMNACRSGHAGDSQPPLSDKRKACICCAALFAAYRQLPAGSSIKVVHLHECVGCAHSVSSRIAVRHAPVAAQALICYVAPAGRITSCQMRCTHWGGTFPTVLCTETTDVLLTLFARCQWPTPDWVAACQIIIQKRRSPYHCRIHSRRRHRLPNDGGLAIRLQAGLNNASRAQSLRASADLACVQCLCCQNSGDCCKVLQHAQGPSFGRFKPDQRDAERAMIPTHGPPHQSGRRGSCQAQHLAKQRECGGMLPGRRVVILCRRTVGPF